MHYNFCINYNIFMYRNFVFVTQFNQVQPCSCWTENLFDSGNLVPVCTLLPKNTAAGQKSLLKNPLIPTAEDGRCQRCRNPAFGSLVLQGEDLFLDINSKKLQENIQQKAKVFSQWVSWQRRSGFPGNAALAGEIYQNLITYMVLLSLCIFVGQGMSNFIFCTYHQVKENEQKLCLHLLLQVALRLKKCSLTFGNFWNIKLSVVL